MSEEKKEKASKALLESRREAQRYRRIARRQEAGVFIGLLTPTLQIVFNGDRNFGEVLVVIGLALFASSIFLQKASKNEAAAIEADLDAEIAENSLKDAIISTRKEK